MSEIVERVARALNAHAFRMNDVPGRQRAQDHARRQARIAIEAMRDYPPDAAFDASEREAWCAMIDRALG